MSRDASHSSKGRSSPTAQAREAAVREVREVALRDPESGNVHSVQQLAVVVKLNQGNFLISESEVQELYDFLDVDKSGELEFEELAKLLKTVLSPPCTDSEIRILWELTDQSGDGRISAKELHKGLISNAFVEHYAQLRGQIAAAQQLDHLTGAHAKVTRDLLVEKVGWRANRDDAFRTLPFSLAFMSVFIATVVVHLRVWQRQQAERAVENFITGYGLAYTGPYLQAHVFDQSQMWDWIELSALPLLLGYCGNSSSHVTCPLAARSMLVGDIKLQRVDGQTHTESEWLLGSATAQRHLASPATALDYQGAAIERLKELRASGWTNDRTTVLSIGFISFAEDAGMFAVTEAALTVDEWGLSVPTCITRAAPVDPYREKAPIFVDVLYVGLLLYPIWSELRELCTGIRLGGFYDGCVRYWGFWNGVDWVGIMCALGNIIVWVMYCVLTEDPAVQDLLTNDSPQRLIDTAMEVEGARLADSEDHVKKLCRMLMLLQFMMAFNVISIMLKFFKAFQANPRLQLVTNTLIKAAEDLFHFGIVFLAIFFGFAITGHVLFGSDLVYFSSFDHACNTAFLALLGECGWYADLSVSDKGLGSGMPFSMVVAWFYLYTIFVLMILLNMLLAIIMDHYMELVNQVRKSSEAPALWHQAANFAKAARTQRGFIPMSDLHALLKDRDTPAHPAEGVTAESLAEAFPTMKENQVGFLLEWLQKEAQAKVQIEAEDETIARLKELSSLTHSMCEQVRMIALVQQKEIERLTSIEAGSLHADSRLQGLEGGLAACVKQLEEMEKREQQKVELRATKLSDPPAGAVSSVWASEPRRSDSVARGGAALPPNPLSETKAVNERKQVPPPRPNTRVPEPSPLCCRAERGTKDARIMSDPSSRV